MDPSIMIIAMIFVLLVMVIFVSIFLMYRSRNVVRQQVVPPVVIEMQQLNPNASEAQVDNQAHLQRPTPTATPHPPPGPGATAPLLPQIPYDSGRAAEEDAATPEILRTNTLLVNVILPTLKLFHSQSLRQPELLHSQNQRLMQHDFQLRKPTTSNLLLLQSTRDTTKSH